MLARGTTLTAGVIVALAAALSGCTTTTTTPSVTGGTLSIYVSTPPGTLAPEAQDVISAERLAFQQGAPGGKIGRFTIKLVPYKGGKLSDNARQAIGDSTTIAYLGELAPGASEDTIGITNAEDVLQVSPTDTALEETQHSAAIPNSPNRYYESLSTNAKTFARVVPTDAPEAKVLVSEMGSLGVKRLYLKTDGTAYGAALAYAVRADAASSGIALAASDALSDGVLYAGSSERDAVVTLNRAAAGNPTAKLFAPSALATASFASAMSPAAQRVTYISSPGFGPGNPLPAAAQPFVTAFKSAYGHAPSSQAIFGYEAMAAVMAVLREAGPSAANRNTVVRDFFNIRNRASALGTYSINNNGDTSIAPFVIDRVRSGQLVPYKAVQEQG
jgi:branched-chain amino acid transport system substrate-binding protein